MGSPISPIIANLYMEQFEEQAIRTSNTPPKIWYRYVDDTFAMLHIYDIESFTNHLNSINPFIKFTREEEQDGKIPFLDVQVHVQEDGSTTTTVYRKSTHTDQYLNFMSNHHLEHKRSVVRTLLNRAELIVQNEEDKQKEIKHVREALRANGYQPWMLNLPPKRSQASNPSQTDTSKAKTPLIPLPYINGLSESLARTFKKYGITTYHKPTNTMRQLLVNPKDKTDKWKKTGTIYHITCQDCKAVYIGETGRALETRIQEHQKITSSAVHEHCTEKQHSMDWSNIKILDREQHPIRRKIKEAIHIHRQGRICQ